MPMMAMTLCSQGRIIGSKRSNSFEDDQAKPGQQARTIAGGQDIPAARAFVEAIARAIQASLGGSRQGGKLTKALFRPMLVKP